MKAVFERRLTYPVVALLKLAQVPRSTYYYGVKTWGRLDPDADIKNRIKTIYHEHKGRYGYRRIRDQLHHDGLQVNHKKVQRIMKELGLTCIVRMKKYRSYKGKSRPTG